MKKSLILASLLLCAVWAAAQTYPSQSSSGQAQAGSAASQTTVQGCLSGSGGNYTLADNSGTTYQLAGDTSKLSEHVGHQVAITGTASSASATSSSTPGASSSSGSTATGGTATGGTATGTAGTAATAQPTLTVSSVKHISSSCSPSR